MRWLSSGERCSMQLLTALMVSAAAHALPALTDVRNETFRVLAPETLRGGGTAFTVRTARGNRYTLTNNHVCEVTQAGFMVAVKGEDAQMVRILKRLEKIDLCLLEPRSDAGRGIVLADVVDLEEELFAVGHPWMGLLQTLVGYCSEPGLVDVLGIKRLSRVCSFPIQPGSSGSPVVNGEGRLVAVVYAVDTINHSSLVIDLRSVREFINSEIALPKAKRPRVKTTQLDP
jgi:S1-C subfamily serine protease